MLWVKSPCRLVGRNQRFGQTCCLHLQPPSPKRWLLQTHLHGDFTQNNIIRIAYLTANFRLCSVLHVFFLCSFLPSFILSFIPRFLRYLQFWTWLYLLQCFYTDCTASGQRPSLSLLMHCKHCGSATLPRQTLAIRRAQQNWIGFTCYVSAWLLSEFTWKRLKQSTGSPSRFRKRRHSKF
jgi:hypothetical protein